MFAAEYPLLSVFLWMLWFFLFVLWIWLLITILIDLFRDHELGGWAKAGWVIFLIFLPFLAVLIYLIARGKGMAERHMKQAANQQQQMDEYIRETAGTAGDQDPADQLAKLADLKNQGAISDDEYQKMKDKVIHGDSGS